MASYILFSFIIDIFIFRLKFKILLQKYIFTPKKQKIEFIARFRLLHFGLNKDVTIRKLSLEKNTTVLNRKKRNLFSKRSVIDKNHICFLKIKY